MKKSYIFFIGVVIIAVAVGTAVFASQKRPSVPVPAPHPVEAPAPIATTPPVHVKPVTILTYHSIEPKPAKKEGANQLHYRITPENFEKQMQYLKDNAYTPITFDAWVRYLTTGAAIPEKSIVLTFDDGWKNQYTYAVPILKKFGFTGTFFIVGKMRNAGYMTWDEVRSLHADGFEVASHTQTHPKLPLLTDEKLVEEIAGSKKLLEEQLGSPITTLAYPYYLHDARVMKAVQDAGYLGARAGWGAFADDVAHIFELKSQEVVNNPNPFLSKRLPD
jgi:peptidoglycan/xylan/chitin deacetylase (PgdA/CDA1 family)